MCEYVYNVYAYVAMYASMCRCVSMCMSVYVYVYNVYAYVAMYACM